MKLRFFGLLAAVALTSQAMGTDAPKPDEVGALIAQAATYQPGERMDSLRHIESLVGQAVTNAAVHKRLEAELPKLLAPSASAAARRFGCKQLAIIGTDRALPALVQLLQSPGDVGFACFALATYPPGKADSVLRKALSGSRGNARVQIIETIGDRRDAEAVALLDRLARGPDLPSAQAAIVALGKIGGSSSRKSLAGLRTAGLPRLEPVLVEAQARVAEELANSSDLKGAAAIYEQHLAPLQPQSVRRASFIALMRLDPDAGEERILQTIRGSDSTLRPLALTAARSLPSKTASSRLAGALPTLPPEEQIWLIESLAARGDADARSAIVLSLSSVNGSVRCTAAAALSRMGDATCVPALAKALTTADDAQEQHAFESALGSMPGDIETEKALLAEIGKAQRDARARLILALAPRRSPAVLSALFEEADSPDPVIAKAAYRVLATTATGDQLPVLLGKLVAMRNSGLRSEVEQAVAQAVVATDDPAERSAAVRRALDQQGDVATRCSLLRLLPLCGDARSLFALNAATSDTNPRVRDAAVRALADWPDVSAWSALMAIWQKPEAGAHRSLALRGLVRLADESNAHANDEILGRYRDLVQGTRGDEELRLVLGALGGMAYPGALELALPLLAKPGVRAEAEVTVRRIAEAVKDNYPQAAKDALAKLEAK